MKTLLIDNEPEITELLKDLLKEYCPDVEVVGTASGVLEGIAKIKEHQPDLIFLDVEMDDGSGFDLINNFTSPSFQVIFVTAHNKYAIMLLK